MCEKNAFLTCSWRFLISNTIQQLKLEKIIGIWVIYMSSSFWLLGDESRDFSHAEKEIHKMTIIFTQNGCHFEKSCHFVNLLSFASSSLFLSLKKITGGNSQ